MFNFIRMRFFQRTMGYSCTIENVYIICITMYHISRVVKKIIKEDHRKITWEKNIIVIFKYYSLSAIRTTLESFHSTTVMAESSFVSPVCCARFDLTRFSSILSTRKRKEIGKKSLTNLSIGFENFCLSNEGTWYEEEIKKIVRFVSEHESLLRLQQQWPLPLSEIHRWLVQ